MMPFRILLMAVALLAACASAQAAGDAGAGKAKAQACAACHGLDGNSANPQWPKLAGQHASYLVKQLEDFKAAQTRKDPVMGGQAQGLSPADMRDLAAFFAQQSMSPGSADPAKVAKGEKIYRGGVGDSQVAACIGCHGPSGAGNPAAFFPKLSGQHAPYIAKVLRDFRSGTRANDAGKMMQNIVAKMSDEEIEAVASYIQGLH